MSHNENNMILKAVRSMVQLTTLSKVWKNDMKVFALETILFFCCNNSAILSGAYEIAILLRLVLGLKTSIF